MMRALIHTVALGKPYLSTSRYFIVHVRTVTKSTTIFCRPRFYTFKYVWDSWLESALSPLLSDFFLWHLKQRCLSKGPGKWIELKDCHWPPQCLTNGIHGVSLTIWLSNLVAQQFHAAHWSLVRANGSRLLWSTPKRVLIFGWEW